MPDRSRSLVALVIPLLLALNACVPPPGPQAYPQAGAGAPAAGAQASTIPGRYVLEREGQRAEIVLAPDGSALFGGEPGRWQLQDGTLMLHDGHQWVRATVDGDVLAIHMEDGTFTFQRDGGDAATSTSTASASAPAPAGAVDRRLVGCWEDFSGSSSGIGNGQMSRTVTFGADGTYVARSFVSISAGDLSSVDEDVEEGRWSADGGTLSFAPRQTAAYQAGFQLEGGFLFVNRVRFVPCG